MLKYTIKRILAMIPQLFILSILVFLLDEYARRIRYRKLFGQIQP